MKRIGLLAGMSWESSVEYYRIINREVASRLGGVHSADILMRSFDFQNIYDLMCGGDWDGLAGVVGRAARGLVDQGADCVLICTNTVHNVAAQVQEELSVPLIHIADAAGHAVKAAGQTRVGLLGTRFTMELDFYAGRLAEHHGIEVLVPDQTQRGEVDRIIFEELVKGELRDESRTKYVEVIADLASRGAQSVVLGCTEIPLLVGPQDSPLPLHDTTTLHALAAVDFALSGI
ncbi:aspartate/glutamate racemase family protein [Desulfovibrio ferrophilus]|uniref:Aspartate racemase n=1 Tax=Desulfovibrio ferrophilus TaxID=241368 RepID=A0A2Z6B0A0_9BACT|nr:aspartate/glutamate racemase family protein [Desulfovibrio ferrophilus]BBD08878.1 aspartate racemase [Desulfovibrio ferrophilus]